MQTLQQNLIEHLDPAHIFRWKATDKIRHYEHSHGLQVRDNTICASAAGQDCVGVDLKKVKEEELKAKFGNVLTKESGSWSNDRYIDPWLMDQGYCSNSNLGNARITHDHMKEVIDVIPPKDALKLGQISMFFMNIKERLYDRMCEEWQKGGKTAKDDTPLNKLLLAKNQADLVRDTVVAAIPKQYWQQSQHLSHHA